MRTHRFLFCRLAALNAISVLALLWPGPADSARVLQAADKPKQLYFGIENCSSCHKTGALNEKKDLVCLCVESHVWETEDKHRQAYLVLEQERAQKMGELMGIKVTESESCVNCHGVVIKDEKHRHKSFNPKDGVSCVVCHGAYFEWVDMHGSMLRRDEWRSLNRQEKQDKYGMTDLWDPAKRAQLCASCHIGNAAEGKVVTHEMYAAGHPPLPAFEIATFSKDMPRHWQYLREKTPAIREIILKTKTFDEKEETKLAMVGTAVSLRAGLRLLAHEAARADKATDPELRVIDFAQFDCTACHHDLKRPSWRQVRQDSGIRILGRPQLRPWSNELLDVAIRHAAGGDAAKVNQESRAFKNLENDLVSAVNDRPFGDNKKVNESAARLADWADRLVQRLNASPAYDESAARSLLKALCVLPNASLLDFDAARHLAWAIRTIYSECKLADTDRNRQVQAILDQWKVDLKLQLPAGKDRHILKELSKALQRQSDYDPAAFGKSLNRLAELLKQ